MTDMELAEEIERRWRLWNGQDWREADLRQLLFSTCQQIIAALRRAALAQTEINGHMRVEDDLKVRIAELEKAIVGECEDCGHTILTPLHPLPSVEKDAERYRWLRSNKCLLNITIEQFHPIRKTLCDEFADAAIDAALHDKIDK